MRSDLHSEISGVSIYCDSMAADVLVTKGEKRTSNKRASSNTRGEDNIISNGSIIAVNDGQCMLIVDQGKICIRYFF